MPLGRSYSAAFTFSGVPLENPHSSDNHGLVDDNQTVYSKDAYVLLERDPPGSNSWVKRLLTWENFQTQQTTTNTATVGGTVNTGDVTVNVSLGGAAFQALLDYYTDLLNRLTVLEGIDFADFPVDQPSTIAQYTTNVANGSVAGGSFYTVPFETTVRTVAGVTYSATPTPRFIFSEIGRYYIEAHITKNATATNSEIRFINNDTGEIFGWQESDSDFIQSAMLNEAASVPFSISVQYQCSVLTSVPRTSNLEDQNRISIYRIRVE